MAGGAPSGPAALRTFAATLDSLRRHAGSGRCYAVLDACDAPLVLPAVQALGPTRAVSLFKGDAERDQAAFAPYLVSVDAAMLDWIVAALWAEPWGIFIIAGVGLEELRHHLRKLLHVRTPEGDIWYCRFYDPRLLAPYLETFDDAQLAYFFGPVQAYGVTTPGSPEVTFIPRDARAG